MPTGPEFQRLQRGQRVPAALLNAHSEALEAIQYAPLPLGGVLGGGAGGMDAGGNLVVPPAVPVSFLAQITAKDASTPPKYSWSAWLDPDTGGAQAYDPSGTTGGPGAVLDYFPAYPYDPTVNVPVGSVVLLEPSTWGECFRFFWQPFSGTIPGSPTFSGTPVFAGGFTVTGGTTTVSGGTVVVSGTTALNWTSTGAFTFSAGGMVFGQTTNPTIRPAGYLVVPWITGGQVPTYTGAPGEVVCNGKYQFQSDGTDWWVYVPWDVADLPLADGSLPYLQSGAITELPVGSTGDVLTVIGGVPAWQAPAGGGSGTATVLFVGTPATNVTNTTTKTSIAGAAILGSKATAASYWTTGKVVRVTACGVLSLAGHAVTWTFEDSANAKTFATIAAGVNTASSLGWQVDLLLTYSGGTVHAEGTLTLDETDATTSSGGFSYRFRGSVAPSTNAQTLDLFVQIATGASASDTITQNVCVVEALN